MIPFNEIDAALRSLGKGRAWLADASGRKPASIRVALAPKADLKNRSEFLQRALSDAIERERARQSPVENRPPNFILENRMKTPTTAEMLRNILDRVMSGEELPESVAEYRHVAGEISAWGAKFSISIQRRAARRIRAENKS